MGEAFAGQDVKYIGIHPANASPIPNLFPHPSKIRDCRILDPPSVWTARIGGGIPSTEALPGV